jgi:hypothetical protein
MPAIAVAPPPVDLSVVNEATPTARAIEPDPIFVALTEHRRRYREWSGLCAELSNAESEVKEYRPSTLIAWRNYSAIGGGEIEMMRDRLLAEPRANRKKIEQEYQKAKADERAADRAEREWYKRNGLAGLQAETDRASKAEQKASLALTRIRPTTTAGAGALVAYIRKQVEGEEHWQIAALANAARALHGMPIEALPPFAAEVNDLDLANAVYNMGNCDFAIHRLYKKHGDEADSRDDYQQIEAERKKVLDTLATTRAHSSNGLVAKAEALTDRLLAEDYDAHGRIAASLGEDVLRYFGARVGVQS